MINDLIAKDNLAILLKKLDIKSASKIPGVLRVESLETVMRHVTFDMSTLQRWPKTPKS
jgi:hypothetical protein